MPSNLLRVHRIEHRRHDGHRDGGENEISELARLRKSGDERTSYHIEIIVNNPLDAADDTAILRRHRFLIDLHDGAVEHPQARARRHEAGDQSDHRRRVRIVVMMRRRHVRKILAFDNRRRVENRRRGGDVDERRRGDVRFRANGRVRNSTRRRVLKVFDARASRHKDGDGADEKAADLN